MADWGLIRLDMKDDRVLGKYVVPKDRDLHLGRRAIDDENVIQCESPLASRTHGFVRLTDDNLYIKDLNVCISFI